MCISAIIGAGASILGGVLSSKSSKKAATTAAQAQTDNTAQNNALLRDLYGQNSANMQPFMQSGRRANSMLDSLLYGGPGMEQVGPQNSQAMIAPGNDNGLGGYGGNPAAQYGGTDAIGPTSGYSPAGADPRGFGGGAYGEPDQMGQYGYGMSPVEMPQAGQTGQISVTPGAATGQTPQSAWDTFRNSTNYQFRLGEGMNGVQQQYAGAGALQSGAAMKDISRFNQNFASNELNNYLGLLQGQQGLGLSGASALAGVSNNYGNQVTNNNNNAADALSNAALLRGQANSQMYGGIAQGLGSLASSFKW